MKLTFQTLTPLLSASKTVGKVLSKGNYVVYESTVYPGCTEEDCVPVLEEPIWIKFREDFKIGYSQKELILVTKNIRFKM